MALQTLSNLNIINGNTIQAADVSHSIDAFTGTVGYAISLSGSFTFTGATTGSGFFQNAVSSSRAISSSYALSSSVAVSSSYALSSSAAISSSYAVSSSYALSSSYAISSTQVNDQTYYNGTSLATGNFKFVAGKVVLSSGVGSSSAFPTLAGKTIGTNAFITATYADGFVFTFPTDPANLMTSVTPDGRVAVIQQATAADNGSVIFTGIYV